MDQATWKALLQSVPLIDIVQGHDVDFGEHLLVFNRELTQYDWPRESAPLRLGEALGIGGGGIFSFRAPSFAADYSLAANPLSGVHRIKAGALNDNLLVWALLHTQNAEARRRALYHLCIISAARLVSRTLASSTVLTGCLRKNLRALAPIFEGDGLTFHCHCDQRVEARAKAKGAEVRDSDDATTPPSTGDRSSVDLSDSPSRETEASAPPPPSTLTLPPTESASAAELLAHLEQELETVRINFCEEVFTCMQTLHGWSTHTLTRYYEICSTWHTKICDERLKKGSAASRGDSSGDSATGPHRRRRRGAADQVESTSASEAEGAASARRREVLRTTYGVLRSTHKILDNMLALDPEKRLQAATSRETVAEFEVALRQMRPYVRPADLSPAPEWEGLRGETLRAEMSRQLRDVPRRRRGHLIGRQLSEELRRAFLCLCGSAHNVHALAWLDATAVSVVEALGYKLDEQLIWTRARWTALDLIHTLYNYRLQIQNAVPIASQINKLFRVYAPKNDPDPPEWLESVLYRIHKSQKLFVMNQLKDTLLPQLGDTTPERLRGLAALTCEYDDMQKSKSTYWVHIHPYIHHLLELNVSREPSRLFSWLPSLIERCKSWCGLAESPFAMWFPGYHPLVPLTFTRNTTLRLPNAQKIVTIPFEINVRHMPVFRIVMLELVVNSDLGPPEYCEAYVDCLMYSVFREASPKYFVEQQRQLDRGRLFWFWEEFKEYILTHEKCYPTKFMLDARPEHYAAEFLRCVDGNFATLSDAEEVLRDLRNLARSAQFCQEVAKRKEIVIELT